MENGLEEKFVERKRGKQERREESRRKRGEGIEKEVQTDVVRRVLERLKELKRRDGMTEYRKETVIYRAIIIKGEKKDENKWGNKSGQTGKKRHKNSERRE